jgi:hypothetical protein
MLFSPTGLSGRSSVSQTAGIVMNFAADMLNPAFFAKHLCRLKPG